MRNLLAFLRRFRVFLLFVFLQVIALYINISYFYYPKSQFLTTSNVMSAKFLEMQNDVNKHFALEDNNIALQRENIQLRMKLKQSKYQETHGKVFINDTAFKQQYTYIPATIINSTVTRRNNYFTLNVGKSQGVYRGLGVFSNNGIVGIVHTASEHYCIVKSVLTKDINIDILIERSGLFGFLKWDGKNPRIGTLTGISNDIKIKKWSTVVTRGGSGIFPKGIPVGKVIKAEPVEGEPLWDVRILFSENYRILQNVYVIKNLHLPELRSLEQHIPEDEEDEDL
ncbi:MAG: hypothetical protein RL264_2716 [Bacteroidota bacterium]